MRSLKGWAYYVGYFALVALGIFHLYTAIFGTFEAYLQRSIHLLFALPLVFVYFPFSKKSPKDRVPWYDWILVFVSALPCLYAVLNYERIIYRIVQVEIVRPEELIFGIILVVTLLEATRRVVGLALTILASAMILYMYLGHLLPGQWKGMYVSFDRIIEHLYLTGEGIFSTPLGVSATIVMIFLIFGGFLEKSGTGNYFMDLAKAVAGKTAGGPAKIAVISSGLFGSISGSAVANVYATGTFTIPMMKQLGFQPTFAGAVEAVASSGGQIMPPVMGAAAFIMASFLGIPYSKIIVAAFIPALLYYFGAYIMVHLRAKKLNLKGLSEELIPSIKSVLKNIYIILPIVVLVVMILRGYTPMRAAIASIATCWLVSLLNKGRRMGPKQILDAIYLGSKNVFVVAIACATAGIVVGAVSLTGVGFKIVSLIFSLAGNNPFMALVMVAILSLILGMGLPTTAAYIVASALAVPALIKFGFSPLSSHMFVFYFAVFSAITPPVALAAYAASSISGASPNETGFQALKLGIIAILLPFAFCYDKAFLMQSTPFMNLFALISGICAALMLGTGIEGYLEGHINLATRFALILLGLLSLCAWIPIRLIGLTVGIALLLLLYHRLRKEKNAEKAI
ncbi:TRAP transporter permease [Pseudothermotoga thermarum]|uniref:TRAP transporter, 4TM/12TM fusion protein n=1 Tax=Pseudothermotoga thermarum DSM 5069 TaxID=688269 RepID=F7YUL8_9THEM|nr:TRAP transporter permease [Pseudothermotoga thermarum]AEH51493.1 TRAP transporter, 4TM/12TM fusion protein [Pseudothermotoga thermarum DSM 5069]